MSRADQEGWVVACKDDRIRRRVGERALMSQCGLRVFCLTNGHLNGAAQVDRFRSVMPKLLAQAPRPGPWMFGVYAGRIEELTLYDARPIRDS